MSATLTGHSPALKVHKPVHFEFVKQQLPGWLLETAQHRLTALKQHRPDIAEQYRHAAISTQRLPFKQALETHWSTQNAVDKELAKLSNINEFAEPLLKNALRDYGDIDVLQTSLRLYAPAKLPWWAINTQPGVNTRTTTLLEAALHNFSASETFVDFAFLSNEDERGQRDKLTFTHRMTGKTLTAETFKALCRDLDIGAQYLRHVTVALGYNSASVASSLREKVIDNLKAGLSSAAHMALARKDIAEDSYALIQSLLQKEGPLELGGQALDLYTLDLLDTRLTGIVVIAPEPIDAGPRRMLVYIPEDPAHPLKEYAYSHAFIRELTSQLRNQAPEADSMSTSYQQFFSQFVTHEQRGVFFSQLNALLSTIRWHGRAQGDNRPSWRPGPVEAPDLRFRISAIRDDTQNRDADPNQNSLWHYLYRVKRNKLVSDARQIAISTYDADRMARWAWWDNLEKMLSDILNAALQVITPFVPVLGELMLAYTAYQVLDDVFEGIVDWAEGQQREGWEHILSVADNLIQLALFGVGAKIGETAAVKLSSFMDQLQSVQLPSGETRLWNPDLTSYQHRTPRLTADSAHENNRLFHHQGKQIANVENSHYEIRQDPATQAFHIAHPKRPTAYRPPVALNGSGACVIQGEQPRTWNNTRLLRRLGPQTAGLSASELEQIRLISGVEFGALRHMYIKNEPTPPLLADTLKRFSYDKQIRTSVNNIRTGLPLDPSSDWFEQMVTELEGWPKSKALLVYPRSDLSGVPRRYGNATVQGNDALALSIADVMSGKLPEKVIGFLDEQQVASLLGKVLPKEEREQALRERLAAYIEGQSETLSHNLYARHDVSDAPDIQLLRDQYPDLPLSLAQRLVAHTQRRHLSIMGEEKRLPLDVQNQARELDFEAASSRMFEQVLQGSPPSAQTESLLLNTLRLHSDGLANLRIQVRERTPTGKLRTQVGAEDAATLRILVRNRKGQYRLFDTQDNLIHGPTDFYSAIFQALPADERFIDGDHLRSWLIEKTTAPSERRLTMTDPPIRARAEPETLTLLRGGDISPLREVDVTPVTLQGRIKHSLPQMSEQGVKHFARLAESPDGLQLLEHLETESRNLQAALDTYVRSATRWPADSRQEAITRRTRADFASSLLEAWQEGYTRLHDKYGPQGKAVTLDLSEREWPDKTPTLPIEMGLVTHLELNECNFATEHADFLRHFPNLRELDLSGNRLDTLPAAIADMPLLKDLYLNDNALVLNQAGVEQLSNLTQLRRLDLAKNPLGQAPDISKMPNLMELDLSHTGISEWPAGLFAQDRDALFLLQLQGNPITTIPEVTRNSDEAFIVAYARLDRSTLSASARELWDEHKIDSGLDPYRTYPPKGESDFWIDDLDDENQARFDTIWDDLEKENGSQGFFEVIAKLAPPEFFEDPEDEWRYEQNRPFLTSQVRQMLSSMHNDPALRQELFRQSSFPGLCPDAGKQIFTEMGIKVGARAAELYSRTPGEREDRLIKLARGAARLKLLNSVARADIAHRLKPLNEGGLGLRLTTDVVNGEPGTVDEVEVHLAYQTSLARRLRLPWISDNMVYRVTANVPEKSITNAYNAVQALSEGDGLVDQILKEPYWKEFLKEHLAQAYETNEESIEQQMVLLDRLHSEQQAFSQSQDLSEDPKKQAYNALKAMVEQLQIEDRVVPGQVMSEELYNQLLNDLGERRKEWLREQTRLSLGRLDD